MNQSIDQPLYSDIWDEKDSFDVESLDGPILIVGASGFIGSKLFFNLLKRRKDVYAASTHIESRWRILNAPKEIRRNSLISLDITDRIQVEDVLHRLKPRTVFNLSAYGAYERQSNSQRIHLVNYIGILNLIHVLAEHGCSAFVQAGSSSEYGLNCAAPLEGSELLSNSDYSVSKGAVSLMLHYYGKIKHFPGVNLRLYSIYGPWEERDRLIPNIIKKGLVQQYPPLVDPTISRDFVYIDDCLRAFVRAALTACKTDPGLSINVCTGVKTSIAEIAQLSKNIFSIPGDPSFGSMPKRKWDLSNWYGNPQLGEEKLGWKHRVSLEEGLRLTAQWESQAQGALQFVFAPKSTKKVTAIIACYRDHQAIPVMHENLTKMFHDQHMDYEIIFVNDNSPTEDETVIRQIACRDPHVIGVSHSRNFGSQSAFISGMEIATGDAVVLMDGDLQDPPEIIPSFLEKWNEGYDVVYGVRTKRVAALYMQLFYKVFYRIFKQLASIPIPVDAGDFSLMDRKVVEYLISFPEKDVFLRGLRAWVGFKQIGVPYVRPDRRFGTTTNNFMKNIWWAKKAIFSFSLKPLEYIQRLAVVVCVMTFLMAIFYLINYFIHPPKDAKGATTIILLMLGIGGIQLFSLSIIGDYLGKVLEEVKNRPRFIRSRIFKGSQIISSQTEMLNFIRKNREATIE